MSGFHNLGSRNWHDSNWTIDQQLGEDLVTTQTWDDGSAPALIPFSRIVGVPSCLADGEGIEHAIDPTLLVDGYPLACFTPEAPPNPLWQEASSYDRCTVQRFYARIIDWLSRGEDQRIIDAFLSFLGPTVVVRIHRSSSLMPTICTAIAPTFSIAVSNGTQTFQQLATQAFESISRPTNIGSYGTLPLWYDASSWIHSQLAADGASPLAPVMLVGHSYGAAAVLNLAARYRVWEAARKITYLTFGCPKPGDDRMIGLLRTVQGIDLGNDSDLVTVLPPDYLTLLPVMFALGLPGLIVWDDWKRPPNQMRQDEDGSLHPNGYPFLDYSTLLAMANRILIGLQLSPIAGHPIAEYLNRIVLRCPDAEWPLKTATIVLLTSPGDIRYNAIGGLVVNGHAAFSPTAGAAAILLGGTGGPGTLPPSLPVGIKLGGYGGQGFPIVGNGGVLLGGTGGDGSAPSGNGGVLLGGTGGDGSAPSGNGGVLLGGSG